MQLSGKNMPGRNVCELSAPNNAHPHVVGAEIVGAEVEGAEVIGTEVVVAEGSKPHANDLPGIIYSYINEGHQKPVQCIMIQFTSG